MKRIKTFETFANESKSSDWKNMSKPERIKFLVDNFGISKKEAIEIYAEKIKDLPNEIKAYFKKNESVGDLEDSFVDINIDETDLETSDTGKLNQKTGKIIIETPSKTDAYNAKMSLGGDVIQEPGFADKQIHHVKSFKNF